MTLLTIWTFTATRPIFAPFLDVSSVELDDLGFEGPLRVLCAGFRDV